MNSLSLTRSVDAPSSVPVNPLDIANLSLSPTTKDARPDIENLRLEVSGHLKGVLTVDSPPNNSADVKLDKPLMMAKSDKNEGEVVQRFRVNQLTTDLVRTAHHAPLLIEVGDQYASIVATSKLKNGTEVFTLRYGITEASKFPAFPAISLLYVYANGKIAYQPVVSKDEKSDEYNITAEAIAQQLSPYGIKPTITQFDAEFTEVPNSHNATSTMYDMGVNHLERPIVVTIFYKNGTKQIGTQMEVARFIDENGKLSISVGSMVNSTIEGLKIAMRQIIEQQVNYGITDETNVHFFRDDTHTKPSVVRQVKDYYTLAGLKPRT